MRIGLVSPPWIPVPPPAYGGIEVVVDGLARALQGAGHDVVLVAHPDSTCPVERRWVIDDMAGAAIGSSVHETSHVLRAYELLDGEVDVIHDHTIVGAALGPAEQRWTVPVVVTNHGPFDTVTARVFQRLARTARVVAISHDHASTGRASGVDVAAVVHHGLDVERVPTGSGEGGYALFLGRMAPSKGVRQAIEVARRAGVPLRIAAKAHEPAEHEYFDTCVRPLLGGTVEYLGEVGGADKQALLGGAIALVNPIQWAEPFGMVMLEALAVGTPVLAMPRGAAPEIVDHELTGYLCRDEDDMAERLASIAGAPDPLRRHRCRAAARRRFSLEAMADAYVGVYRTALGGTRQECPA